MSRAGGSRELNNQYTSFSCSLQRLSLIQAGRDVVVFDQDVSATRFMIDKLSRIIFFAKM